MKTILISLFLTIFLFSISLSAQQNKFAPPAHYKSVPATIAKLKQDIPQLMKQAEIPGISIALIRGGKIVWVHPFGVTNAETREPVTNKTIFEAASLSKVVFTYGALKLVDEGKLDLDTPLNKYLGNNYDVGDDRRLDLITARRVLTHTSGFPNWRPQNSKTLPINFTPGEKFSYSGEGIVYLSKVVEKITGMRLEDFMRKMVFVPLQMKSSSFIWEDSYNKLKTYSHDSLGKMSGRRQPPGGHAAFQAEGGNAAADLHTTAEDYARFVVAILNGTGLKKETWQEMLKPQVNVDAKAPQIYWGLGVGLEMTEAGESFWHWGDNGNAKAYVTAFLPRKDGVVYFANSANGLSITTEILEDAIGGSHPGAAYLDYERYNSPSRLLFKSVISEGAVTALKSYRELRVQDGQQNIAESKINELGYMLLRMNKVDDALEIFRQNTVDFPQSWNAWDSLAEAYMTEGDKDNAIKYYEKSLELNPDNKNAAEQLKKLKL